MDMRTPSRRVLSGAGRRRGRSSRPPTICEKRFPKVLTRLRSDSELLKNNADSRQPRSSTPPAEPRQPAHVLLAGISRRKGDVAVRKGNPIG